MESLLLQLIVDNGLTYGVVLFIVIKYVVPRLNKIFDLIDRTLDQASRHDNELMSIRDNIGEHMEKETRIKNIVDELRLKLNADRILYCELHNGGTSLSSGLPFLRFSAHAESISMRMKSIMLSVQNLHISFLSKYIPTMLVEKESDFREKIVKIPDVHEELKEQPLYHFAKDSNTVIALGLFDAKWSINGFFIIQFKDKTEITEQMIDIANEYRNLLQALLR